MMEPQQISGVQACVFDAYGTLFDVHSAVGRHAPRLGDKAGAVSALWRQKQLEYTWLRSLMHDHLDFWQVTGQALAYALEFHGIQDEQLQADLGQAYLELDCYEEVPAVLAALKDRGIQRGILSNGEPRMLASAVTNAGLGSLFDHVLSVEEIRIYKPDQRVYQLACDRFALKPEQICFMSSNAWDVAGAAFFGFQVVWINRFGQPRERLSGEPALALDSLAKLPDIVAG